MSDIISSMYFINGLTILIQCLYTLYFFKTEHSQEQLDYLRNKICRLEKHILILEQNLEDLEENIYKNNNNDLTESKLDSFYENRYNIKQKQLEDFIDYDS